VAAERNGLRAERRYVAYKALLLFLTLYAAKCLLLYSIMRKWNMVLLCHVGREHSLDVAGERPGNPLHLRRYGAAQERKE
jgi:hypothetical protein